MFKLYYLLPLLIPAALLRHTPGSRLFLWLEHLAGKISRSSWRSVTFVGVVSFLLVAGLGFFNGIPAPQTHDEFGYLLLGDTFAHGRLTNPTPALWQHFETIHEILKPTYTAKYPPGQGFVLAIGEWLWRPILGIWLSCALACATVCWMFLAWMRPRWAVAGGLMVALHPQILQWSQNYWGGAVALGGGALVLGAFRRILRAPRVRDAVWLGVGMGVLANSRPYEGFVLSLLILLSMVLWFIQAQTVPVAVILRRVFLPLAAVLVVVAAQVCYYNRCTTGNPLVMPYMVHEETYGLAPLFVFGTPRPEPAYGHREIQKLQENYLGYFQAQRQSFRALIAATEYKISVVAQGYLWSYLLVVPLLALPWALRRDRWLWFNLFICFFFGVAVLLGTWVFPHYAAPAAGLFFVLAVESMRELHAWHWRTLRFGRNIVRALALLFVVSFFQIALKFHQADPNRWNVGREAILENLARQPGKSLVIVQYAPDHNPHREWVYNGADFTTEKVLWARDMGPEQNRALLDYYKDRRAWIVDADAPHPEPRPYGS